MTRDTSLGTSSKRGLGSRVHDPLEDRSRRVFLQRLAGGTLVAFAGPVAGDWLANDTKASHAAAAGPAAGPPLSPHIKGRTPFAVILCRFNDLPPLSIPQSAFTDFFSGAGKGGVCDYYKDISYGTIDLTGSRVYGWYPMKYSFFREGNQARGVWIAEAVRLAKLNGVDLSQFYGVVAVVNANVDDSNDGGKNLALGIKADWGQSNWRWCNRCQGLAFAGKSSGSCPAGGPHDLSTGYNYALAIDMPSFPGQNNWRWCRKCQGLAYAGSGPGQCPAGGAHDPSASADYRVAMGAVGFPGQNKWRWCKKCQGMAYDGKGPGPCPSGGKHDHSGSADYTMVAPAFGYETHFDGAFGAHEMGHCFGLQHAHCADKAPTEVDYCDPWDIMGAGTGTYNNRSVRFGPVGPGLSAGNLSRLGWIPEGRIYTDYEPRSRGETIQLAALSQPEAKGYLMARIVTQDRIFTVEYRQRTRWDRGLASDAVVIHELRSPYTLGQNNWKWCKRCQSLAFAGFGPGPCPSAGVHDHSESGDYSLISGIKNFTGQNNWRWCWKCQGLAFAGSTLGACPASGAHDFSRSLDYVLLMGKTNIPGQSNWRWCKKCNGLAYGGRAGVCAAGGPHDYSGSGDYTLLNFGADQPFLLQSWQAGQRWVDFQRGVGVVVNRIDPGSFTASVTI